MILLLLFACSDDDAGNDCIDPSSAGPRQCPLNIDFVCGCNGVTYNNACEAGAAGVLKWTKGECGK